MSLITFWLEAMRTGVSRSLKNIPQSKHGQHATDGLDGSRDRRATHAGPPWAAGSRAYDRRHAVRVEGTTFRVVGIAKCLSRLSRLAGLFQQSVFGRLPGYVDVNDVCDMIRRRGGLLAAKAQSEFAALNPGYVE